MNYYINKYLRIKFKERYAEYFLQERSGFFWKTIATTNQLYHTNFEEVKKCLIDKHLRKKEVDNNKFKPFEFENKENKRLRDIISNPNHPLNKPKP